MLCKYIVTIMYLVIFLSKTNFIHGRIIKKTPPTCNLSNKIKNEIKDYQPLVNEIIENTINGRFKGTTYEFLSRFVDKFGARLTGSKNLEKAIDYMIDHSRPIFDEVIEEEVLVPHWVRGKESAIMIEPKYQDIPMLGSGYSIGTPPEGIQAGIVVVKSFEELDRIGKKVENKIVVYNQEYTTYADSLVYRIEGADRASKYGAVATLIRSVTPFSLRTPHTGMQKYSGNVTKIPTACITIEDARMLQRRYLRGENVTIILKMEAKLFPDTISRNTLVDIKGKEKPEDMVIISGHIDSWDVGVGALDDGAGAIMSWNALYILKTLNLQPKRTLRAILWTGEEFGDIGAQKYAKDHENEFKNINFIFESDLGTFTPEGLIYSGADEGACILQEITNLFTSLNATKLERSDVVGSDITVFNPYDIPEASLLNKNEKYFWFYHSAADTIDVEDPIMLDQCTAFWAAVSYIIADLSFDMPRKNGTSLS